MERLPASGEPDRTISESSNAWRRTIDTLFAELAPGSDGEALARQLAQAADHLIRDMICSIVGDDQARGLAFVATGGYGSGMLCPHSDIDILLLHRRFSRHRATALARQIIPRLWDTGFKPGFAVRTVPECIRLARQDVTCLTSLHSLRFLVGDPSLALELQQQLARFPGTRTARRTCNILCEECRSRLHPLEQGVDKLDAKNGPGGLRDIQRIEWIVWLSTGRKLQDVPPGVWKRMGDDARIQDARRFFWTLRWWLCSANPRAGDRVERASLPVLARRMQYTEEVGDVQMGAVRLMREYLTHSRAVLALLRRVVLYFDEPRRSHRVPLPDAVYAAKERLWEYLPDRKPALDPPGILQILDAFARQGAEPGARLLDTIEEICRSPREEWAAARRAFVARMGDPNCLGRFLRLLDTTGVLDRLIPGWSGIRALVPQTAYHTFAVDEHSIIAVEMAAENEASKHDPLWSELATQLTVRDRQLLHLALLVHDIGKGYFEDHSRTGAGIVRSLAQELVPAPGDADVLVFLVSCHLALSHTAFHRDPSDAEALGELAETVSTPRRLRLLYMLTVCDILATGPGRLTRWKLDLLQQTYLTIHRMLTGESPHKPSRARATEIRSQLLQAGLQYGSAFHNWVALLPTDYLTSRTVEEIISDYRELRLIGRGDLRVLVRPAPTGLRVTVYAHDRPRLLLDIVAGLYAAGTEVVNARATTLADGSVIDEFMVIDHVPDNPDVRCHRIRRCIEQAASSIDPRALATRPPLVNRVTRPAACLTPRIAIESLQDYTLVEVFAPDYPGLLYDILSCFYQHRIDVRKACVATYGDRAVDAFYVTDEAGRPLLSPSAAKRLKHDLIARLCRLTPARNT